MVHLGDICKINGAEIEPVWCITGGSPCQDLSIAGKRAGLAGARSGLFMEQVRIVKEMREADKRNGRTGDMVRPRYLVWENVVGAFSSNKGKDFAAVLEEIIKIVEPEAPGIEVPEKGWPTWGGYHDEVGGRWSVVWRTHDAQYWGKTIRDSRTGDVLRMGTPQRRRRISVVADLGGDTAAEIQFDSKSLSGDIAAGGTAGEGPAEAAEAGFDPAVGDCMTAWGCQSKRIFDTNGKSPTLQGGIGGGVNNPAIFCLQGNGIDRADTAGCNGKGWREDACYTLNTIDRPAVCAEVRCLTPWEAQSARVYDQDGVWHSLNANENGGMARDAVVAPAVALDMTHACDVIRECGDQVPALQARMGTGGNQVPLTYGIGNGQACEASIMAEELAQTLNTMHDAQAVMCSAVDCRNFREGGEVNGTLQAKESGGQSLNLNNTVRQNMVVRRLTPMECERLQGFPDHWTDIGEWIDEKGKKHKDADSPRYKALGNSIALPFWDWMLRRMAQYLPEDATLGSLFDGIAGFPLIWERIHGRGTARWASEIEQFPIAVTRKWFGEG